MIGELVRFAYLRACTLGWLTFGPLRLATLEEPWIVDPDGPGGQRRETDKRESCVPDGTYDLVPHDGARFKNVYALVNPAIGIYRWSSDIPAGQKYGRSTILIHNGNTTADIEGCVLVGLHHAHDALAVIDSRIALDRLRAVLGKDSHQLTIRPFAGTKEAA